ncbi:unnamed protein product [Rotaria sp. Silwood2]|nr:unnamed protein product [Rotaria sp. Silwood2]CAF4324162.1 unnamed protein product [Rotaria sp. Silwood2]
MISYQWDYQKYIIDLYKLLIKLNYKCWLDIFQMGGGDSLFEKIDNGIRYAKCVIACITPKYTKSINCRREMSLSDALSKPIIPLLLELTDTWPPSGPMSMIFTGKSFIDFRRSNKNIQNDSIWKSKQFKKLLAQLKEIIPEVDTGKFKKNISQARPSRIPVRRLTKNEKQLTIHPKNNAQQSTNVNDALATELVSRLCSIM